MSRRSIAAVGALEGGEEDNGSADVEESQVGDDTGGKTTDSSGQQ